jgi:hypothetical protein
LKTYEERIKFKKSGLVENHDKLLYTRQDNNSNQVKHFERHIQSKFKSYKGNQRGGMFHQGGKEESSTYRSTFKKGKIPVRDLSKVKCFKCEKFGHYQCHTPAEGGNVKARRARLDMRNTCS